MVRTPLPVLTALAALTACQPAPPLSVRSPVQTAMFQHFALARSMRTLTVNGDLEGLRATADSLARLEDAWGLPPGSSPHVEAIHSAARRGAAAESPEQAAESVAEVARACGDCHLATDSDLGQRFQVATPRTEDPAIRHINLLSWASRLMWDGLVGPSDRMWETGAEALSSADGLPAPRAVDVPRRELERADDALRVLAEQAVAATDPGERTRVLSRLWTMCAECHIQAGLAQPSPDPGLRP